MRERREVLGAIGCGAAALVLAGGGSTKGLTSSAFAQSQQPLSLPADGTIIETRNLHTNALYSEEDRAGLATYRYRRAGSDRIEVTVQSRRASDGQAMGDPRTFAGLPFLFLPPPTAARLDWTQLRTLLAGHVGSRASYTAVIPANATQSSLERAGEVIVADRRSIQTPLGLIDVIEYVDDQRVSGTTPQGREFVNRFITRLFLVPALGIPVKMEFTSEVGPTISHSISYIEGVTIPGLSPARMPFKPETRIEFMPPFWEARSLGAAFQCNFNAGLANLQRPDRIGRRCEVMGVPNSRGGGQILWGLDIEEGRNRSSIVETMAVQRVVLSAYMETDAPRPPQDLARRLASHYGFSASHVEQAYRRDAPIDIAGDFFTLIIGRRGIAIEQRT